MAIYYKTYDTGSVPVVLLHGWGFHNGIWDPLLAVSTVMCPQYFTFYCIDLPGFGGSQDTAFVSDAAAMVELLLPVLPSRAIYVGWSMGGLLALKMAMQYPQSVQGLLMLSSTPCFLEHPKTGWSGVSLEIWDRFYHSVIDNPKKALSEFIHFALAVRADQRKYNHLLWNQLCAYPLPAPSTLLEGLLLLKKTDMREDLAQCVCPTYCIYGDRDPLMPYNVPLQNPLYVKTRTLPGVGHMPHVTHAPIIVEALKGLFMSCKL